MFDKDLTVPIKLLMAEALVRRISEDHPVRAELEGLIKKLRSGYNGEKTINYYLSFLPEKKYYIFHDLRLPSGHSFFQIDVLLLSPKGILLLEGKNHSGKIHLDEKQMIHESGSVREIHENPLAQAKRHKILLSNLLAIHNLPVSLIDFLVVISRPSTELSITSGYTEAQKKVWRAYDLIAKVEELDRLHPDIILDGNTLGKIRKFLLKNHRPVCPNLLKKYNLTPAELIKGVQCPACALISMVYHRNRWICPKCQTQSKDAHLNAIDDYFLLIKPSFNNSELREFLGLPTPRSTTHLLSQMNFSHTGSNKGRVYYQS